jgi:pimeloyl-ACP methyl ester carboxylesterase
VPEIELDDALIDFQDSGSGRPLLFVHGWGAHAGFFREQARLADGMRVVIPDLPGHGRSPRPARGSLSVERLARDLGRLLDRLDLRDVVAVGWSMGAMVLWRALLDGAAGRCAALVTIDMSPRITNAPDWPLGLLDGQTNGAIPLAVAAMRQNWPGFAHRVARRMLAADARPALGDWVARQFAANDPDAMAELWDSLARQDFRNELGRIGLPTLVVHGTDSLLYAPATAEFLTAALADARRLAVPGAGHAPHLEKPGVFNDALIAFAAGLSTGEPQERAPPGAHNLKGGRT